MTADCFLDTNVLFYAAMARFSAPAKYERARALIAEVDFGLSGQVLAEFVSTVTRKTERPLTALEAATWIETLRHRPIVAIDFGLVSKAIQIADRFRISYWDAGILAAAETMGADIVYSEDLSHGQFYGTVRVENPFRSH